MIARLPCCKPQTIVKSFDNSKETRWQLKCFILQRNVLHAIRKAARFKFRCLFGPLE